MKLKGYIQSGTLFIGDPSYMAGNMSQPGSEALESPENPFYNWDKFTHSLDSKDAVLPFTGSDTASGRGVVVQLNQIGGKYEIEKVLDDSGKLVELKVKFYE